MDSVWKYFLYSFINAYGRAKTAGVSIRVTNVLKPRPKTIDTAKFDHQSTILLPTTISLEIKSKLTPIAKGKSPKIVVREVRTIGLSLCLQAFIICNDWENIQ